MGGPGGICARACVCGSFIGGWHVWHLWEPVPCLTLRRQHNVPPWCAEIKSATFAHRCVDRGRYASHIGRKRFHRASRKQPQCACLPSQSFWPRLLSAPYGLATMRPRGSTAVQNRNLSPIVGLYFTAADCFKHSANILTNKHHVYHYQQPRQNAR